MCVHSDGRQDPRDEVQRERALERRPVLAGRVERDALLQEDRVAAPAGGDELLGPERVERRGQRDGVRARRAVGAEELVEEAVRRAVARQRACGVHLAHARILGARAARDHWPGARTSRRTFARRSSMCAVRRPRLPAPVGSIAEACRAAPRCDPDGGDGELSDRRAGAAAASHARRSVANAVPRPREAAIASALAARKRSCSASEKPPGSTRGAQLAVVARGAQPRQLRLAHGLEAQLVEVAQAPRRVVAVVPDRDRAADELVAAGPLHAVDAEKRSADADGVRAASRCARGCTSS